MEEYLCIRCEGQAQYFCLCQNQQILTCKEHMHDHLQIASEHKTILIRKLLSVLEQDELTRLERLLAQGVLERIMDIVLKARNSCDKYQRKIAPIEAEAARMTTDLIKDMNCLSCWIYHADKFGWDQLKYGLKPETTNFRKFLGDLSANFDLKDILSLNRESKMQAEFLMLEAGRLANSNYYLGAKNAYLEAIEIWEELQERELVAVCLCKLGRVYRVLRDIPNGIQVYEKSLRITTENKNMASVIDCMHGLCQLLQQEPEYYTLAIEKYSLYCEILKGQNKTFELAQTLIDVSKLYMLHSNYDSAKENLLRAVNIYRELNTPLWY